MGTLPTGAAAPASLGNDLPAACSAGVGSTAHREPSQRVVTWLCVLMPTCSSQQGGRHFLAAGVTKVVKHGPQGWILDFAPTVEMLLESRQRRLLC